MGKKKVESAPSGREPASALPAELEGQPHFGIRQGVAENVILQSLFGNRFYFCPKVKVWDEGRVCEVVGSRKFDVTDSLQPYLLKKYRRKE